MKLVRLPLRNPRGQSLVQVMVSVAIMGILLMAMLAMYDMQTRENKALTEKLAANDLARVVTAALATGNSCNTLFTSGNLVKGSMPFDASTVSPATPYVFTLKQIFNPAPSAALATAGGQPSALSNSLSLLANAANPPGIQFLVTSMSPPTAMLQLNFDQTKLIRPIKNLQFPVSLQKSGPLNKTTINACQGTPSGGIVGAAVYSTAGPFTFTVPPNITNIKVTAVGGGGGGSSTVATGVATVCAGMGGNGGTIAIGIYPVTPGDLIAGVVGAGGLGGAPGQVSSDGSTTTFGGFMSAPGGTAGYPPPANPPPLTQSPSGTSLKSTGGNIINGSETSGQGGVAGSCVNVMGGAGGPGPWGGGGSAAPNNGVGQNAAGSGGGGGGGSSGCSNATGNAGGNGASGIVIIEY